MKFHKILQQFLDTSKNSERNLLPAFKNQLQSHNFVIFNGFVIFSAFKKHSYFLSLPDRINLNQSINQFSEECFSKRFNFDSKQEWLEIQRNKRVLRFFAEDYFFFDFRKRELGNIIQEDVFFNSVDENVARNIGLLTEVFFKEIIRGNLEEKWMGQKVLEFTNKILELD